jgi:hypothetical protein
LSTSSQQLAITTHLNTQLLYTSIKIWKLSKIVSGWYNDCLNVVNDGNHLRELRNSVYHSAVLESTCLKFSSKNLKGRDLFGYLSLDERILLKLILNT